MKKYIQSFKVYHSDSQLPQEVGLNWLSKYMNITDKALFEKYSVKSDYINSRDIYAKGIVEVNSKDEKLFSADEESNPGINKRSKHAQSKIVEIFENLYEKDDEVPDHLNHVSCTHYQSPSAAQKIILKKGWFNKTVVTHLYHMGCYAALPAVRVSKSYVADGADRVDVVHTELCSFHLNKEDNRPEQIIMNTLFADGAIKYAVTSKDYFDSKKKDGFEVIVQKEVILPNSEKEMSWNMGNHGFVMTLTRKVPLLLAKKIENYMREIFDDAGLDYDKDKDDVIFAVHPGGPKIIELVEKFLKLRSDQVGHSKKILESRGNMSSATIPHIWNEILEDKSVKSGTYIATVAFGPGLTITGAVLKLCRH